MGLGLYQVENPLPMAQAAMKGASQSYAAMTKQQSQTTTTTTEKKGPGLGGMLLAGIGGAALGFLTGGTALMAGAGAISSMMNYMS